MREVTGNIENPVDVTSIGSHYNQGEYSPATTPATQVNGSLSNPRVFGKDCREKWGVLSHGPLEHFVLTI